MERILKFRAWDKEEKKWIDPERIYIGANGDLLSYGSYDDIGGFDTDIDVQFFTGLKDKNGKEIYEGDIIECIWGNSKAQSTRWEVRWVDGAFCLGKVLLSHFLTHGAPKRVIGNVYENAELLTNPS